MRLSRDFGWILGLLLMMGVASWIIYGGYELKLRTDWQERAETISKRLQRSLSDTQLQLGVLAESLGARLKTSWSKADVDAYISDYTPLIKRLGISEILLHKGPEVHTLFSTGQPVSPKLWRATVFDFFRTYTPQLALELTEYGPRVLDMEPLHVGGETFGLEVSVDLQRFLNDFARREGVDVAFLVPESRWPNNNSPRIKTSAKASYQVLSSSSPQALEVLERSEVQRYIGQSACGMSVGAQAAYAIRSMDDIEYRSQFIPTPSGCSAILIWLDYTQPLKEMAAERRNAVGLAWTIIALVGGALGSVIIHYHRKAKRQAKISQDALRLANQSLATEVKARQHVEEQLRGIADEMYMNRLGDRELLWALSHQLKLNASATIGFAEILKKTSDTKDMDCVDSLTQLGTGLFFMAENIDLWSRHDTLQRTASLHSQNLGPIVEKACAYIVPLAARKAIRINVQMEKDLCLKTEAILLEQVIKNLLMNAIKYSPRGAKVELVARKLESGIELAISDEGLGISLEEMEKIFELRKSLKRGTDGEEGLGLGMLITKWVCDLHGAQLRIASDEGQGCRIVITFPNADAESRKG